VIALAAVGKRFGSTPVLEGVDLRIGAGDCWGLIGPAGAGKSVLLKLLCGLVDADTGTVTIDGTVLTDESTRTSARASIGMLFQNNALFDFMSVGDNVAFPLVRRGELGEAEIKERVADRLRAVGLAGAEAKWPSQLSGGMRKRVALARAVVARSPILIFDEPTAGLDPVTTAKIYNLLRAERDATGATVIAVSSDVDALCAFAPRTAMLYRRRLRYAGLTASIGESDDPVVRQFVSGAQQGPL
jgi:phospholipid/cholesterol/gamma-HCH transport system ATP-binding protein